MAFVFRSFGAWTTFPTVISGLHPELLDGVPSGTPQQLPTARDFAEKDQETG
ncbi:hypothetical protein AAG747_28600 [Rapidithrix thailandica]|uniref:Uncharacterized protein n=1 Tax=Rapidithrix thailandica TaxID=413964 RepID=A0AAW9SHF2_9BACT